MYKIKIKYKLKGDTRWRQATYRSSTRDDAAEQVADAVQGIPHLDSIRIPRFVNIFHDTTFGGWVVIPNGEPIQQYEDRSGVRLFLMDPSSQSRIADLAQAL